MNMYQSPLDEEKEKNKKLIKIMAIALAILFVMSICILVYISYLQKKQLKLYIDDARINLTSDMIIINDDNIYISINDIAGKIGYAMNNGEYKEQYSEDTTKCHLTNKYEAASYIQDSDEIYKTIISDIEQSDVEHEYFTIDEPVFSQNNKLYTTLKGLEQGCNLDCSYNNENNTVTYNFIASQGGFKLDYDSIKKSNFDLYLELRDYVEDDMDHNLNSSFTYPELEDLYSFY